MRFGCTAGDKKKLYTEVAEYQKLHQYNHASNHNVADNEIIRSIFKVLNF